MPVNPKKLIWGVKKKNYCIKYQSLLFNHIGGAEYEIHCSGVQRLKYKNSVSMYLYIHYILEKSATSFLLLFGQFSSQGNKKWKDKFLYCTSDHIN